MRGFCNQVTLMGRVIERLEDVTHQSNLNGKGIDFKIRCRSGDEFYIYVTSTTNFQSLSNLDNINRNRYGNLEEFGTRSDPDLNPIEKTSKYLNVGRLVVVEGVLLQNGLSKRIDAKTIHLLYDQNGQTIDYQGHFLFESTHWWVTQMSRLADVWLDTLYDGHGRYNFSKYRTNLNITFGPTQDNIQEMATLSRLIYGLSSAYLLTGSQRFLDAATAGVNYQREYFRSLTHDGRYCFWAYGKRDNQLIIPSESDEPLGRGTIPLYEQIYALAGLIQYYRVTLEWETLDDIRRTVNTFIKYFHDSSEFGGFFSHLDPATLKPKTWPVNDPILLKEVKVYQNNPQQPRKNWNSIGDHIPAYLVNLILALEPLPLNKHTEQIREFLNSCKEILKETATLIAEKFPEKNNDFVQERFYPRWEPDTHWDWQQDRGIVGHNLKIAWNLTRVSNYYSSQPKEQSFSYALLQLAERIAQNMVKVGAIDTFRGGCFDALERHPKNGMIREYPWLNTKDFWQQEQGILAYLILYGKTRNQLYLELAQEMMAFWNIFFLDRDRGGVYFRVNDNGSPVITGRYGKKADPSISGYHVFELCFLTHLYLMTYVRNKSFCLFFKPDSQLTQTTLNVLPDFFPPNAVQIQRITINGVERSTVDPDNFQIELGPDDFGSEIVVEFQPLTMDNRQEFVEKTEKKGKIGVLVESHFDETEIQAFSQFFPKHGYEIVYISRLWNNPVLEFTGNEHLDPLRVRCDVDQVNPSDFKGFILVGGYAMDRLRYEDNPQSHQDNQAPALNLIRKISQIKGLKLGTICHSLWLLTPDKTLLRGKKVTCAHNIIDDVKNSGAEVIYQNSGGTVNTYVDGDLITAKHPGVVEEFMKVYLRELEKIATDDSPYGISHFQTTLPKESDEYASLS
ncbi:hypothetical protein cce_0274 [Crocosphaera subtropica ATCC 51142]|uniref:DJ-1/PfpI domain-containing protein n=1 Tax=Crocosphaera subtropica (strain ATCC 51142 / BH68) TaxID=43989 RepID=B1X0C4_CROS5|nr:DJ-1/PfpI family protein [Crocosphaera subtropica]ACB49625.1 hypothetical protein cce_0274 [Crocosphaera subtropica ATCC 51142]